MARPLRIEQAGSWYHVTARGNERREIYRDARDRQHFVELVEEAVGKRIELLRGYRWSSYRAYIGLERAPRWLECGQVLALGGGKKKERRRRYREYVEDAIGQGMKETPWESLRGQVVLGTQEFLVGLMESMKGRGDERRRLERLAQPRPDWARAVACVEQVRGELWKDFRERHGDAGRDMVLHVARREGGLTLSDLAQRAGLNSGAAVAVALRRYGKRLERDPDERGKLTKVSQLLIVRS